jgi:hypothetical protein
MNHQFLGRVQPPLPTYPSRRSALAVLTFVSTEHRRNGVTAPFTPSLLSSVPPPLLSKQPKPTALLPACSPLEREAHYAIQ